MTKKLEFIMKYFNSNFKINGIEINNYNKFNELDFVLGKNDIYKIEYIIDIIDDYGDDEDY